MADNTNNNPNPEDVPQTLPVPPVPAIQPVQPIPPTMPRASPWPITIVVPDLRNGTAENIAQGAPHASLANEFKWPGIKNLPGEKYVEFADAVIRAQYAQIYGSYASRQVTQEVIKSHAIVLGSIRAGAAAAMRLEQQHFNLTEVVDTGSEYTAGVNGAAGRVTGTPGNDTMSAKWTAATSMTALTRMEANIANLLMFMGMAVPLLQGASLVTSNHHYLPSTKNIFQGLKNQCMNLGGETIAAWLTALGPDLEDLAFHKACHPISPPRKRSWAKDESFAGKLSALGLGAAAVRLPAIPTDAQCGKAGFAVLTEATPVIRGMSHTISTEEIVRLNNAVVHAGEGREEIDACAALGVWFQTHISSICFCAGIISGQAAALDAPIPTCLKAKSISKAMASHRTEVSQGTAYARIFRERSRREMEDGSFSDPNIIA